MRLLGFKNLSKSIRNSDEKRIKREAYIRAQMEVFFYAFIINAFYFLSRLDDAEVLKHTITHCFKTISLFEILFICNIPFINRDIKKRILSTNKVLEKLVKFFRENGINTSVENLKQAEINKARRLNEEELDSLSIGDSKVLKGSKESIKIKTLDGEIKTLKQYRAICLQSNEFRVEHNELYVEDDEFNKGQKISVRSLSKYKNK